MELAHSQLDLTQSYLDTSHYSNSSNLLDSRLSAQDLGQMEKHNLLHKLLQLFHALDNTQNENQLLRIEKAQLRNQLQNTKHQAQLFIQNNLQTAQSILNNHSNHSQNQQKLSQSPPQSTRKDFMTPTESAEDLHNGQTTNKVFIKSHKRGISNNCIVSDKEIMIDPRSHCYTLMNSPSKQESIKIQNSKGNIREKSANKLTFPKNKLNALVEMERQYEERNIKSQDRTLENFESFYCHKKDDFGETQRWNGYNNSYTKPKSLAKNNYNQQRSNQNPNKSYYNQPKITYNDQKHTYNEQPTSYNRHKVYQPFQNQQQYENYDSESERNTEKCLNKSMSSSGLSNRDYCNSRGFKIPTSIDQIWGSSNKIAQDKNGDNTNKTTRLSKVNANKASLQRKTYLNY